MKNRYKISWPWITLAIMLTFGSTTFGQGIRKHYTEMTEQERVIFKSLMIVLDDAGVREDFADLHANPDQGDNDGNGPDSEAADQIHGNLEFLSWHRQFIREFEREIQNYADYITIPYWDWTGDSDPPGVNSASINSPLWADDEIASVPWADNILESFDWEFGLTRNLGAGATLPTSADVNNLYLLPDINVFHANFEAPIHNPPHVWVGGQMATPHSPRDPVFYFHHAMIDKIWQNWTEIPGHNSGFDDQYMPSWNGDVFPFIDQNSLTDSRVLGIFYSDAANAITRLDAYTVTNNVRPIEKFYYQYKIQAENTFLIPTGKNAEFRSCSKIVMKPGFKAELGSSFLAKIDADCDFTTLQMVSNDKGGATQQGIDRSTGNDVDNSDFKLHSFPNPFSNQTTIEYSLSVDSEIAIDLFNVMGQKVQSVLTPQMQLAGTHKINLSANDLPAGIYYCALSSNRKTITIPLMINE